MIGPDLMSSSLLNFGFGFGGFLDNINGVESFGLLWDCLDSTGRFPSLVGDSLELGDEGKLAKLSLEPGAGRLASFCTLNLRPNYV